MVRLKNGLGGVGTYVEDIFWQKKFCATRGLYPFRRHPSEISTAFLLFFAIFSMFSGRSGIFSVVLHPDGTQNAIGEF